MSRAWIALAGALVACGGRSDLSLYSLYDNRSQEAPRDAGAREDASLDGTISDVAVIDAPADASPNRDATDGSDTSDTSDTSDAADASDAQDTADASDGDVPALAASTIVSFADTTCLRAPTATKCWGLGMSGQLGDGTTSYYSATPRTVAWTPLDGVSVGNHHACGRTGGTLACWGHDYYGELGHDAWGDPDASTCSGSPCYPMPAAVPGLTGVRSVTLGFYDTCVILAGGAVSCFGFDQYGECGVAPGLASSCQGYPCVPSPTTIPGITGAIQLALATGTACALRSDGTVWCWGSNYQGTLARDPDAGPSFRGPAPVPGIDDARAIAAGDLDHVCVIRADGSVWCWGRNNAAQTGQPLASNRTCPGGFPGCIDAPAKVPGLPSARALAVGYSHSCAITTTDALYCWGSDGSGQLGFDPAVLESDGGLPDESVPVAVNLPPVDSVAAGEGHTCAVLKDRSVRCWGQNYAGQLGVDPKDGGPDGGPLPSSFLPVTVGGL